MKGESNGYSERLLACLLALLVLGSVATVVGAVSVTVEDRPESAEVGTQVSSTVLLTDLYRDPNLESWRLQGRTQLNRVTWTITFLDQGGNQINQQSIDGQEFSVTGISLDDDVSEVRVKVTGTTPTVQQFRYEPHQSFQIMALTQAREGGTSNNIGTWQVPYYTQDSLQARQAIDAAAVAIQDAQDRGGSTEQAQSTFDDAVAAYETGSFDLAVTLSQKAQEQAGSAQQSAETLTLAFYAGIAILFLALLGVAVYWYQHRETSYDRLG